MKARAVRGDGQGILEFRILTGYRLGERIPALRHTIDKSICQDFLDYAACEENGGGGGAGGDRRPGCDGGRAGYGGLCYSIARLAKPRKQKGFRRFGPTKRCQIRGHPGVRKGPLRRRKQKSALL